MLGKGIVYMAVPFVLCTRASIGKMSAELTDARRTSRKKSSLLDYMIIIKYEKHLIDAKTVVLDKKLK